MKNLVVEGRCVQNERQGGNTRGGNKVTSGRTANGKRSAMVRRSRDFEISVPFVSAAVPDIIKGVTSSWSRVCVV